MYAKYLVINGLEFTEQTFSGSQCVNLLPSSVLPTTNYIKNVERAISGRAHIDMSAIIHNVTITYDVIDNDAFEFLIDFLGLESNNGDSKDINIQYFDILGSRKLRYANCFVNSFTYIPFVNGEDIRWHNVRIELKEICKGLGEPFILSPQTATITTSNGANDPFRDHIWNLFRRDFVPEVLEYDFFGADKDELTEFTRVAWWSSKTSNNNGGIDNDVPFIRIAFNQPVNVSHITLEGENWEYPEEFSLTYELNGIGNGSVTENLELSEDTVSTPVALWQNTGREKAPVKAIVLRITKWSARNARPKLARMLLRIREAR